MSHALTRIENLQERPTDRRAWDSVLSYSSAQVLKSAAVRNGVRDGVRNGIGFLGWRVKV